MERTVEIKGTPKEVAELLFNLDNKEVAEVFAHWKNLFDEEYKRRKEAKETIWIFDLNHFLLYVVGEMDNDGKDIVRSMYSSLIYKEYDNLHKRHLLDLHLS